MSSLWCLYNLARHPEVQEKLHQEVISVLGEDGDVTPGSLAKMSYLKACVKESSRQVKCGSLQSSSLPSQIGFSSQLQRAELTSEPIIITNASGCICEKKNSQVRIGQSCCDANQSGGYEEATSQRNMWCCVCRLSRSGEG